MVMASHAFAWPVDTERVTLGIEHFVVLDCRNFAWGDLRVILVSSVGRHDCSLRIAQPQLAVRWGKQNSKNQSVCVCVCLCLCLCVCVCVCVVVYVSVCVCE